MIGVGCPITSETHWHGFEVPVPFSGGEPGSLGIVYLVPLKKVKIINALMIGLMARMR